MDIVMFKESIRRTLNQLANTVTKRVGIEFNEDCIEIWCELYDPLLANETILAECAILEEEFAKGSLHVVQLVAEELLEDYLETIKDHSTVH